MKTKSKFFKVLVKNGEERGATLVEYGLLVALIVVIGIPVIRTLGDRLDNEFENVTAATSILPVACDPMLGPCL